SAYYLKSQGPFFGDRTRLEKADVDPNDAEYHLASEACGGQCQPTGDSVGYYWTPFFDIAYEDTYNVTGKFQWRNFRFETVNWQYLQGQGVFSNATQTVDTNSFGLDGASWDFRNNSASMGYLHEFGDRLTLDTQLIVRHTEVLSSSHEQVPDPPEPYYYYHLDDIMVVKDYARPDDAFKVIEQLKWSYSRNWVTTLGGEYEYNSVPQGYGSEQRYKSLNWAGYWQQYWKPLSYLAFTGGYRYDYNTIYGISHTPRLGSIISPSQNLTFKVLASTGFRAPTAWESFNATRQRKANPDLRPERMRSLEVGVGYRFFEKYSLSVHQYYTRISDLLLEVETNEANPDLPGSNYNQNQ
ncbi:MAG: TonB-dependent receptor, partial [Leptospiraceae bacterium]|nr:TonB-dependent receptor [Leptospiraceae bacterium]